MVEDHSAEDEPAALAVAADIFATWESLLADSLRDHGVDLSQAEQLATLAIAAVEGAVAMCRAQRSIRPLDHVANQLESLIASSITG